MGNKIRSFCPKSFIFCRFDILKFPAAGNSVTLAFSHGLFPVGTDAPPVKAADGYAGRTNAEKAGRS